MDAQGRVTSEEVRIALRAVYQRDREINLQKSLLHALRDDLKPEGANGRWRPNQLLVMLSMLIVVGLGAFYFLSGGSVVKDKHPEVQATDQKGIPHE